MNPPNIGINHRSMPKYREGNSQLTDYYGKDEPSASFKWGVIVPNVGLDRTDWRAVAWFKSRKRADEYAKSGWRIYAIARLK